MVQEDWLAKLIEAFDEHQADWVFGPSCPEWPSSPPTWYSDRVQGNFAVLNYGSRPFLVSDETRPFFGLNFAGTMEAHLALGGFRTDFGLIGKEGGVGEDMDLFLRALRRGMRIAYTPDALVKHVIPAARATKRYQREHIWRVNRTYYKYLKDEFPRVAWSLGLPRFFFRNALGDAAAYLRGLFSLSPSLRFYHELQLVRFARLVTEAARNGFPKPTHPPANGQATHQEASR